MQEMIRINIDILGTAETFWDGMGDFETTLPETEEKFRVFFSGGGKKRKGVAFITRETFRDSIKTMTPFQTE